MQKETPMTNATIFFTFSILCLVALVAIFALKYLTAGYRAKSEQGYRDITNNTIEALRQEIANLAKRVQAMEKLLKEVE
jgi:uncharacterized protein YlxW (UPF0749 family)